MCTCEVGTCTRLDLAFFSPLTECLPYTHLSMLQTMPYWADCKGLAFFQCGCIPALKSGCCTHNLHALACTHTIHILCHRGALLLHGMEHARLPHTCAHAAFVGMLTSSGCDDCSRPILGPIGWCRLSARSPSGCRGGVPCFVSSALTSRPAAPTCIVQTPGCAVVVTERASRARVRAVA